MFSEITRVSNIKPAAKDRKMIWGKRAAEKIRDMIKCGNLIVNILFMEVWHGD